MFSPLIESKAGQGSIVAVILASVIGTILVGSLTQWYLSIDKNIGNQNTKLEASTVSMEEWNRLGHMSLEELRAQKETLKEPYPVGDYKVMVNLGEEGYFSDGKCGAVPSGKIANCFNDTTITVFNSDGERQFNSRQLPLQVGIYTKEEIDALLKAMNDDYQNKLASMKTDYETRIRKVEENGSVSVKHEKISHDCSGVRLYIGGRSTELYNALWCNTSSNH